MGDRQIAPLGCGTPRIQADINEAVELREDSVAGRGAQEEDHASHAAHAGIEAVDALIMAAEGTEALALAPGLAVVATIAGPIAAIIGYGILIDHAFDEGERQNLHINDEMARGALTALMGRMDSYGAEVDAQRSPAFADGMARVERFAHTHPEEFRALASAVRASARGGMLAVARGQQDTASFRERMEVDPAFANGVGYMTRLREHDLEAFAQKAAYLERLASDVEIGRQCQIRG